MKAIVTLCTVVVLLWWSNNVLFAQNSGLHSHISAAVTMSPNAESVSALSIGPLLDIKYAFENIWFIGGQVGVSYVSLDRKSYGKESSVNVGNPILMAGYTNPFSSEHVSTDIAVKAGVPLATFPGTIPDNRITEFNCNNANSAYVDISMATLKVGWASFVSSLSLENNYHSQNSVFIGFDFSLFDRTFQTDFNINIDKPNGIMEETPKPFWGVLLGATL